MKLLTDLFKDGEKKGQPEKSLNMLIREKNLLEDEIIRIAKERYNFVPSANKEKDVEAIFDSLQKRSSAKLYVSETVYFMSLLIASHNKYINLNSPGVAAPALLLCMLIALYIVNPNDDLVKNLKNHHALQNEIETLKLNGSQWALNN